jgi:hypothetical protein
MKAAYRNNRTSVPQGHAIIAHRFIGGIHGAMGASPARDERNRAGGKLERVFSFAPAGGMALT